MIEPEHPRLPVARQCELVSISRSGFYYRPVGETPLSLELTRLIDAQFLETPWWQPPDGPSSAAGGLCRRAQAGAAADGQDGPGADLPAPTHDGAAS